MSSLRSLFRWMLAGWLALVLLLSVIVARGSHSQGPGNLLAFLFIRGEQASEPLPPALPAKPQRAQPRPQPPPQQPAVAPAAPQTSSIALHPLREVAAPEPDPEWIPLDPGRKEGAGRLGRPDITVLEDGTVEVLFACSGEPGEYGLYHPRNVTGLSVDLQGGWGGGMLVNRVLETGVARKVQIASHAEQGRRWLRVSAVSRERSRKLAARVEYSPAARQLRVRFAPGD